MSTTIRLRSWALVPLRLEMPVDEWKRSLPGLHRSSGLPMPLGWLKHCCCAISKRCFEHSDASPATMALYR